MRDAQTLEQIRLDYYRKIENIKILQYFFYMQWRGLKEYANKQGIRIIGDIPIYISYNSADVWSNRNLFKLDGDGRMVVQSGCPPDDFFNEGKYYNKADLIIDKAIDLAFEGDMQAIKWIFERVDGRPIPMRIDLIEEHKPIRILDIGFSDTLEEIADDEVIVIEKDGTERIEKKKEYATFVVE